MNEKWEHRLGLKPDIKELPTGSKELLKKMRLGLLSSEAKNMMWDAPASAVAEDGAEPDQERQA